MSAVWNMALYKEYLCLVDNDGEVSSPSWLTELDYTPSVVRCDT